MTRKRRSAAEWATTRGRSAACLHFAQRQATGTDGAPGWPRHCSVVEKDVDRRGSPVRAYVARDTHLRVATRATRQRYHIAAVRQYNHSGVLSSAGLISRPRTHRVPSSKVSRHCMMWKSTGSLGSCQGLRVDASCFALGRLVFATVNEAASAAVVDLVFLLPVMAQRARTEG